MVLNCCVFTHIGGLCVGWFSCLVLRCITVSSSQPDVKNPLCLCICCVDSQQVTMLSVGGFVTLKLTSQMRGQTGLLSLYRSIQGNLFWERIWVSHSQLVSQFSFLFLQSGSSFPSSVFIVFSFFDKRGRGRQEGERECLNLF